MEEMYFTIAGCNHYFGSDFMKKGMKVKLIKEPDNEYDKEAIQVKIKGLGKVGYVANSTYTVKGESMSAGRLYDKLGDKAKGKVVFVIDGGVVCRIVDTGVEENLNIIDSDLQ
ncbi:HIRAN domain-containing protein [Lachnospiraceae bacterium MD308]|nr:HIRAN domain-containing protein [Lachnospiraceae bacterium MD308]